MDNDDGQEAPEARRPPQVTHLNLQASTAPVASTAPTFAKSLAGVLRIGEGLEAPFTNYDLASPPPGYVARKTPSAPETLLKLFPTEGVVLLTLASGLAASDLTLMIILVTVIAAMVFVIRALATRPAGGGRPDWIAVFVAVLSFVLFAVANKAFGFVGGSPEKHALWAAFGTLIWVTVISHLPKKPAGWEKEP